MGSRKYGICLRVFNFISHKRAQRTSEIRSHNRGSLSSFVYNCDNQSCLHNFLCSENIQPFIRSVAFFTIYGYITNSQQVHLPVGLIGHLVEHCTGIAEVMVRFLVSPDLFSALISQLLHSFIVIFLGISAQGEKVQ